MTLAFFFSDDIVAMFVKRISTQVSQIKVSQVVSLSQDIIYSLSCIFNTYLYHSGTLI